MVTPELSRRPALALARVLTGLLIINLWACSDATPRRDGGDDDAVDLAGDAASDPANDEGDLAPDIVATDVSDVAEIDQSDDIGADLSADVADSEDAGDASITDDASVEDSGGDAADVADAFDTRDAGDALDAFDSADADDLTDVLDLEPDVPAVCTPTGDALHFWLGQLRNNVDLTLAPDNPSALPLTSVDTVGDALLVRYDDDCLTWVVRATRASPYRQLVDPANQAIYVALLGGLGTPLELLDPDGEVAASWPVGEEPVYRSSYLARYDFDGNLQWAKRLGPADASYTGGHSINGLHLTAAGLRVVGYSPRVNNSSTTYNFIFGAGEDDERIVAFPLRHGTSFTALLDPATGEYIAGSDEIIRPASSSLTRELRFTGQDGGGTDSQGNFALGGWLAASGSWLFNAGDEDERTVTSTSSAAFFVRYLADGSIDWLHLAADGNTATSVFGVEALSNGASIHGGSLGTGGLFEDSGDGVTLLGEGSLDAFMVRYSATGHIDWLKPLRRLGADGTNPRFLADEANNALYAFFASSVGVTFDDGEDFETTVDLGTEYEYLLARFDLTTGQFVWARRVDSPDRPTITNLALGPDGLEGMVWARDATIVNAGESDAVTVGVNGINRSVMARWDTDGDLIDIVPLVSGTGVLAAAGTAVRVDLPVE